jgi:hypothetical protein
MTGFETFLLSLLLLNLLCSGSICAFLWYLSVMIRKEREED